MLASSSKGNCYRVTDGSSPLLLECGIPFKEIREGLSFRVSDLAGCLVSHDHGDHAKTVKDVLKAGVDVYCSAGTAQALGLEGHRLHIVQPSAPKDLHPFTVGTWKVLSMRAIHDAEDPLTFLLSSGEEQLFFATDTAYVPHKMPGCSHLMLECNYDLGILKANVKAGIVDPAVKHRALHNHMSLEHVKGFLRANDLSRVREIWLLHLSDDNSDAARFKREIQALTGKVVRIA